MGELDKRQPAAAQLAKNLDALAQEINAEHRAFYGSLRATFEHGVRAGELLSAAKTLVPHGQWTEWLMENFEGAPRTAQEYMRLFNKRDEIESKTRNSADLSISGALKSISSGAGESVDLPPEELEMAKAAKDLVWHKQINLDRLARVSDPAKRRGFVAEAGWAAMVAAVREYRTWKDMVRAAGDQADLESHFKVERWEKQVRWWATQQEWIETLIRPVDWPPYLPLPLEDGTKPATVQDLFPEPERSTKTISQLYGPEGYTSPRQYVRELCGPII
jgi:hypothetical protein